MKTGVPQGSVLGPLLFLILINDLANCSKKLFTILFADDTTFQLSNYNLSELFRIANAELKSAADWFRANKLTLNVSKTKYMVFGDHANNFREKLQIDGKDIERIGESCPDKYFKFVGLRIDEKLSWKYQVNHVRGKLASANFAINKTKNLLPLKLRKMIYNSLFKAHLEYGLICWGGVRSSLLKPLMQIQKKCIRNLASATFRAHTSPLFKALQLLKFHDLYKLQVACLCHNTMNNRCPKSTKTLFNTLKGSRSHDLLLSMPNKKYLEFFPSCNVPKTWNQLCSGIKRSCDLTMLKTNFNALAFAEYT